MLFHNAFLARRGCVNAGSPHAPAPLHDPTSAPLCRGGQRCRQHPCCVTNSSPRPSLPLALGTGRWHPMGSVGSAWHWILGALQVAQQLRGCEAMCGSSLLLLPRGISHPGGCWPGICPCYVCLAPICVTWMVQPGQKSRSSPAAGQGWQQLHHGGSLQPPCGCSLPAQPASRPAQAHSS